MAATAQVANSGRSSVGWGAIYGTANALVHEVPSATTTGPLWEFSVAAGGSTDDSDFPVIQNVGGCNTPATSVAIDMTGHAIAVQFVTIYPPARVTTLENAEQQTLSAERFQRTSEVIGIARNVRSNITDTTEYVSGCGTGTMTLLRSAKERRDPNTGFVTTHAFTTTGTSDRFCRDNGAGSHYIVPNAHMARLSVGAINAHTIEAMRLNIVTEDDNQGILKVHGDLKTPALHLGAEEIYLDKLTLDSGAKFRRFNASGAVADSIPNPISGGDPIVGVQKINNLYINSRPWLAQVCGYRARLSPTITVKTAIRDPDATTVASRMTAQLTTALGTPTGCPIGNSVNN